MLGPWMLLTLALTLTLTGAPGGRALPPAAPREQGQGPEPLDLEALLRQARAGAESPILQPDWLSKRQHPGRRDEEEEEEAGAAGPSKRQHPGRREDEASWFLDAAPHKRQHPGRRSPWPDSAVAKRQHPGRRLADAAGRSSREGEAAPLAQKRQHPGKRLCAPQGACGVAGLLLGLLGGQPDADARSAGAASLGPEPEPERSEPGVL